MNNARRKIIANILSTLADEKINLEAVRDEEQDAYDNLPEGLQMSERGERMSEIISELDEAVSSIESIEQSLEGMLE